MFLTRGLFGPSKITANGDGKTQSNKARHHPEELVVGNFVFLALNRFMVIAIL